MRELRRGMPVGYRPWRRTAGPGEGTIVDVRSYSRGAPDDTSPSKATGLPTRRQEGSTAATRFFEASGHLPR
jgi:hypothetical protein